MGAASAVGDEVGVHHLEVLGDCQSLIIRPGEHHHVEGRIPGVQDPVFRPGRRQDAHPCVQVMGGRARTDVKMTCPADHIVEGYRCRLDETGLPS